MNLNLNKFIKSFLILQNNKSLLVDYKILRSAYNTLNIVVFYYRVKHKKFSKKRRKLNALSQK